jgi:lysophospholipase L1-like esterase
VIDYPKHYDERVAAFTREVVEPGGIVLLGSSHFEWFDTGRHLPGHRFVNRGIASDRIGIGERGILHRLEVSVFDCRPAMVLLQNGANDLGELWRTGEPPIEQIADVYEQVVSRMLSGGVERLVLIGDLPTCGRFAGMSPLVPKLNERVAAIAERQNVPYVHSYPPFDDSHGLLREELTTDGLHLNEAGYAIWAKQIAEYLPQLPAD